MKRLPYRSKAEEGVPADTAFGEAGLVQPAKPSIASASPDSDGSKTPPPLTDVTISWRLIASERLTKRMSDPTLNRPEYHSVL